MLNFKEFINIAKNYDLNIDTFCTQREFLIANGILDRKNNITKKCTIKQKKIIEAGYKKLTDKKLMGSIFKFLIISKTN